MPKKMVLIGLIGSTMLMSGCSRSRAFTRGDYSEMQDPFMGGVADSSAASVRVSKKPHVGNQAQLAQKRIPTCQTLMSESHVRHA